MKTWKELLGNIIDRKSQLSRIPVLMLENIKTVLEFFNFSVEVRNNFFKLIDQLIEKEKISKEIFEILKEINELEIKKKDLYFYGNLNNIIKELEKNSKQIELTEINEEYIRKIIVKKPLVLKKRHDKTMELKLNLLKDKIPDINDSIKITTDLLKEMSKEINNIPKEKIEEWEKISSKIAYLQTNITIGESNIEKADEEIKKILDKFDKLDKDEERKMRNKVATDIVKSVMKEIKDE